MDQKLQNLLYSLPTRTAWIILGSCAAYWLLCFTGLLTPPVSAPASIALFWFYAMLMLALASGLAAVALGALLVLRRQRGALVSVPAPSSPAATNDEDLDQLAGLGRMLDGPESLPAPARPMPPAKGPKRKQRKRRR